MLDTILDFIINIITTPWLYITVAVHLVVLGSVAYLILLERKIASWVQDRIGPNRVGLGFGIIPGLKDKHMMGLGQPLADGIKFIVKEDYHAKNVDKVLFTLAPAIMITTVIISIAVIPWGGWRQATKSFSYDTGKYTAVQAAEREMPNSAVIVGDPVVTTTPGTFVADATITYKWPFQIANLNIGVVFVLATLSLAVYGVVIGGWASNNKYSFLGGLRATANMISYEIPLGLSILVIVVMYGTLDLGVIVDKQATYWFGFIPAWNVFCQPVAFWLFLVCIHAEANRAPFDTAEAEQELVGGYHTEYSSMRFALFFLAEYAGMITTSAVCVALFFGGWHIPWIDLLLPKYFGNPHSANPEVTEYFLVAVLRSFVFFGKTIGIIFVFMWVRWSLPRFRFDQIMQLAWRALIPISLALFMLTAVVVFLWRGHERAFMRVSNSMAVAFVVMSVVLAAGAMILSLIIPAAPDTNRKIKIPGSRFLRTPLPKGSSLSTSH